MKPLLSYSKWVKGRWNDKTFDNLDMNFSDNYAQKAFLKFSHFTEKITKLYF